MIEYPPVLVPHDKQEGGTPDLIVGANRSIHIPDELVPGQHVIIRVLISGECLIRLIVVGRFDKRVLR